MSIDIQQLISMLNEGEENKLPPVHLWNPEHVGSIDIRIDDSMDWFHEGEKFERFALVKLFSSILRKDGDTYYLVTPAEKLAIDVEDVPFEIVSLVNQDDSEQWVAITNVEDTLVLDKNSHIELRNYKGTEIPYIEVRNGLFARVSRPVFYQLVEEAEAVEEEGGTRYVIRSSGAELTIGRLSDG